MKADFWNKILSYLEKGEKVFLCLVVHSSEHSPGRVGGRLFLSESETQVGTVGGGIMELNILRKGKELLSQNCHKQDVHPPHCCKPELQTLVHRKEGDGEKSGMICSGEQTNLYYVLNAPRDRSSVEKIISFLEEDRPALLKITPKGMEIVEGSPDFNRSPFRLERKQDSWIYKEELLNRRRIAIIGGGHCSLALSKAMNELGYVVTVFDTRVGVATFRDNFFARHCLLVSDYSEAGPFLSYPQVTHVVIMTSDQPSDVRGLVGVHSLDVPFIGLMGSGAKIHKIHEDLKPHGITLEGKKNLYFPVGLPIGSHSPEEIAVSIAAQIIQLRGKLFPQWEDN